MKRSLIPIAAVLAGVGASSAMAAGETVSAYGNAQVPVTPTDPTKNASILAAIADAQTRVYPADRGMLGVGQRSRFNGSTPERGSDQQRTTTRSVATSPGASPSASKFAA